MIFIINLFKKKKASKRNLLSYYRGQEKEERKQKAPAC